MKDRFTDLTLGVISLDYKVLARVPGSETQGVSADEADLVAGAFSVTFLTADAVEACNDHHFFFTDLTVDGGDRIIAPYMMVQ